MAVQRVSLSKKQMQTPDGAELHTLLQAIKSDGQLSKAEIVQLIGWLRTHRNCDLPAAAYLNAAIEQIVADKVITLEEMAELHKAIEKVMPGESRESAIDSRKAVESEAKQKDKAAKIAEKHAERVRRDIEREQRRFEGANQPAGFFSKIYGVTHQNNDGTHRQSLIRDYVRPGMVLIHRREPDNPYDEWAISLWVKAKLLWIFETERQVGYINSNVSEDLGPHLDEGGWVRITVKEVTGGGDRNIGVNIFIEDGREVL